MSLFEKARCVKAGKLITLFDELILFLERKLPVEVVERVLRYVWGVPEYVAMSKVLNTEAEYKPGFVMVRLGVDYLIMEACADCGRIRRENLGACEGLFAGYARYYACCLRHRWSLGGEAFAGRLNRFWKLAKN